MSEPEPTPGAACSTSFKIASGMTEPTASKGTATSAPGQGWQSLQTSSISVLMPNYNHAKYIKGQLDVLISQTMPPLEIIVIDDASTDCQRRGDRAVRADIR